MSYIVNSVMWLLKYLRRVNSGLTLVKIVWRGLIFNNVSANGPQVGLDEATKREFWEEFDSPP